MSSAIYDKIFNVLKPIELAEANSRHPFNISASGRDQNLKFRLHINRSERGLVVYEVLEAGEASVARAMLLAGRDTILPKDVEAVTQQMDVLKVSPIIGNTITQIVEGLRRMEVAAPVFALNRSNEKKYGNVTVYNFGLAAYVLDDAWEPIGRISLSFDVFEMSQLEITGMKLRAAEEARRAEGQPAMTVEEQNGVIHVDRNPALDRGNDRYKIAAMIQPGSPAMEQLKAKEASPEQVKAVEEFRELVDNKLTVNTLVREMPTGGSYEGTTRANVPDEDGPREPNPTLDKLLRNEPPIAMQSGHSSLTSACRTPGSK